MWLDRLAGGPSTASGQSTPQSTSKSYSPLPQRTASTLSPYVTSQRVGHSSRSSSLSLAANDSTTSLLSSRRANEPSTRRLSANARTHDSVDTLRTLLFVPKKPFETNEEDLAPQSSFIVETDFELCFDFGGFSLRGLATSQSPDEVGAVESQSQLAENCNVRPELVLRRELLEALTRQNQTRTSGKHSTVFTNLLRHAMSSSTPSKSIYLTFEMILQLFLPILNPSKNAQPP